MRSAKIRLSLQAHRSARHADWQNPIVPGDHPDPTILRVGDTFWASSTSSEWSPQFPLFRSEDLVHWTPAGAIFPEQPAWAEGSFWAPELVHDEVTDRFVVWYVAKKRGGPLCVAVATAPAPGGPYQDHGPLLCDADGSIDPCFARDEWGQPFLIWKEDGNSAGRPTPIWAQPLSDDLLRLTGSRTKLITNDQPWEGGIVEGPYILRHADRFYLFYAGNSCCGKQCQYAEGVARADHLLGPWEKFPGNPFIDANDSWRCPGHGTAVHIASGGRQPSQDYLLYHAYPAAGTVYIGREAVLDRIEWTLDADGKGGWPVVNAGRGPTQSARARPVRYTDDFQAPALDGSWEWPVNTRPEVSVGQGRLSLGIPLTSPLAAGPVRSAILAVPSPAAERYRAAVSLHPDAEPNRGLWAGLAVLGDPFNTIGLGMRGRSPDHPGELTLWERRGATERVLWQAAVTAAGSLRLTLTSPALGWLQFFYATADQEPHHFQSAGEPYDASQLPAWDRALRIGLLLEGPRGASATFSAFHLESL